MLQPAIRTVRVSLEREATRAEVEAVERAFRAAGLPADVDAGIGRKSDVDSWLVHVAVAAPLTVFLSALAAAAGQDAWAGLKALVRRVYEARPRARSRPGAIWLDAERLTVILTDELPDEAYRALEAGELAARGYYVWDPERGAWRNYRPGASAGGNATGTERRRLGPNNPE